MKVLIHLSMDYPDVYRMETRRLMKAMGISYKEVGFKPPLQELVIYKESIPSLYQKLRYFIHRSSSAKRCLIVIDDLDSEVPRFQELGHIASYAIHIHRYGGGPYEESILISELARVMARHGFTKVSLDNPSIILSAYLVDGLKYVGIELHSPKRKFIDRRPSKRPVFSPFSLDPKLSRLLINLTSVPMHGLVVDPFCGVGGIPIEAEVIGVTSICIELMFKWSRGALKNIEYYSRFPSGLSDIICGDSLNGFIRHRDVYVATDPPYGRITATSGSVSDIYSFLVEAFVREAKGSAFFTHREIDELLAEHGIINYKVFKMPVHSSLTRYLYVVGEGVNGY